jgi:hypothetical protein
MPVVRTRILAVLAALLIGLSGGVAARAQYFCHMLGHVVPACCCGGEQAALPGSSERSPARAATDDAPQVRGRACCELMPSAARATAPVTRDALLHVPGLALLTSAPGVVSRWQPERRVDGAPLQARERPVRGPPLFLAHCALLI